MHDLVQCFNNPVLYVVTHEITGTKSVLLENRLITAVIKMFVSRNSTGV